MTTVINLFGGSGAGKSTTAALLFARMKMLGCHTELVREYVKLWAWGGRKVRPEDQIYLLGKQSAYESMLYDKVDYIVTDSPVLLAGMYAEWHSGESGKYVSNAATGFVRSSANKVTYKNYFLVRGDRPFDTRGRWETHEQAKAIDVFLEEYLRREGISCTPIGGAEPKKVAAILANLELT